MLLNAGPRLKILIRDFAAYHGIGVRIDEEWDAAAATLVIALHLLGVFVAVPDLNPLDLNVGLFLQLFYERFHIMTMRAFSAVKIY